MSGGPLILTYHSISDGPPPLCIDPGLFTQHLDAIAESGTATLTVSELAARMRAGERTPCTAALTFDDGYADVVQVAAPLLRERGLRATVFCIAGYLGATSDWPTLPGRVPRLPLAEAAELRRVASEGTLEIGCHGFEHAPLSGAGPEMIQRELVDSRSLLERSVGAPVRTLAYPYALVPPPAGLEAARAEYDACCVGGMRRARRDGDPHALPRVDAHYLRRPARLRRALAGHDGYLALRRYGGAVRRLAIADHAERA